MRSIGQKLAMLLHLNGPGAHRAKKQLRAQNNVFEIDTNTKIERVASAELLVNFVSSSGTLAPTIPSREAVDRSVGSCLFRKRQSMTDSTMGVVHLATMSVSTLACFRASVLARRHAKKARESDANSLSRSRRAVATQSPHERMAELPSWAVRSRRGEFVSMSAYLLRTSMLEEHAM